MKGKQLLLVLILLLALGGVALYLRDRSSASWTNSATESNEKILSFPLNDVSHIAIKTGGTELNLVRKEETWRVAERADYPADFNKVSSLLRSLWELRATQDVKAGRSQLGRLQLVEPTADANSSTLIDLKGSGDQRVAALLLGKKQAQDSTKVLGGGGMSSGRFAMALDNADRVFLIAQTFDEAETKPEQWINRDFIAVTNPKSVAIIGATPQSNWKMSFENASGAWKLEDAKLGETLDSTAASKVAGYIGGLGFSDVLAPDAPTSETGLDKPSIITFETLDGFVYELRVGKLMGENYPVLVSVKADLPNERKSAPDEKPENKASLDQQFRAKETILSQKLAKEQKLAGRAYLMAKAPIDQFLQDRSAMLKAQPSPTPPPAGTAATPPKGKLSPPSVSPGSSRRRPK